LSSIAVHSYDLFSFYTNIISNKSSYYYDNDNQKKLNSIKTATSIHSLIRTKKPKTLLVTIINSAERRGGQYGRASSVKSKTP
jgi:hypothetical protein